jgi:hypothetical protein
VAAATVSDAQLNRWTLTRQHLVERADLSVVDAVDALAGMQAQYSISPYVGLWTRVEGFRREHLSDALASDEVVKTTVMRGTLHLVTARHLPHYRRAAGSAYYADTLKRLQGMEFDLDEIRAHVVAEVAKRTHTRIEVAELIVSRLEGAGELPAWVSERPTAIASLAVTNDLVNLAEDAAFGYFGGSRYRAAPAHAAKPVSDEDALRHVATAYLAAFGPATKADLAQWSGNQVSRFAPVLAELDDGDELVTFKADDGRTLIDLKSAARPDDAPAPVRLLPKWDNLLLAYAKRTRVLPEAYRSTVIAKNGDVAPTILIDGQVAGMWDASPRGKAVLNLRPLTQTMKAKAKKQVEAEAEQMLAFLRPDADGANREVRWAEVERVSVRASAGTAAGPSPTRPASGPRTRGGRSTP